MLQSGIFCNVLLFSIGALLSPLYYVTVYSCTFGSTLFWSILCHSLFDSILFYYFVCQYATAYYVLLHPVICRSTSYSILFKYVLTLYYFISHYAISYILYSGICTVWCCTLIVGYIEYSLLSYSSPLPRHPSAWGLQMPRPQPRCGG